LVGDAEAPDAAVRSHFTLASAASKPPERADEHAELAALREARGVVLERTWDRDAPSPFTFQRQVCPPAGRYLIDYYTSPTLGGEVTLDGRLILRQREFPSELSRPLTFTGACQTMQVTLTPGTWRRYHVSVWLRPASDAPTCDASQAPSAAWHICSFRGRNQEEPIGATRSADLAAPRDVPAGRLDSFDWLSLVARRTVCFPRGKYRFHSESDDTLRVEVGAAVVIDAPATRNQPTFESSPVELSGCLPMVVTHTYRWNHSVLSLAWAKVGSAQDREWSVERACVLARSVDRS
jgi:hypothetical protein